MAGSEAFSRVLIDQALKDSGWDLIDPKQVRFELSGSSGRADYVLLGHSGPLAVLEAKNPDKDPYEAKGQAAEYADNIRAPLILLSNGKVHYFWNYERRDQADAFRTERLPSRRDLERVRLRNLQPPRPLLTEEISPDYLAGIRPGLKLRRYQVNALDEVARGFDREGRRKFLLEMATGTGKTLLCAALIRRFLVTRNAERVLFIVDRIELARQTIEEFGAVLHEYKPVIFKTARRKPQDLLGSSVVIATIQSLMTDRRYRTEFTPFHFDLVVNDEAHRSIYGDARECVQFFQATRVGLTATPKAYLKNVDVEELAANKPKVLEARQLRDTYHYFGCEPGAPTFRYDIVDAVKDPEGPFLCMPVIFDIRSDITTQALAEKGWTVVVNEQEETYKVRDLERKIFTPDRNRIMCEMFLKRAQRDPKNEIGQSILFAVSQDHATALTKILNRLVPGIAVTITSRIPVASDTAKEFRDGKRSERIAVTVDMLSTGYNCKPLLNIGLMRPIFSPTEYIQIKGRGTRTYTFEIDGKAYEKEKFFVLDFCGVCEYFEEKYDYTEPLPLPHKAVATETKGGDGPEVPECDLHPPSPQETTTTPADQPTPTPSSGIPVWTGRDIVSSEEVRIVGPDGEKVDAMTFRGSFRRDIKDFSDKHDDFREAVDEEDDDSVETILQERFFNRPDMYYSPGKLVVAYDIPAPTPAFVYDALGKRPLPRREDLVQDAVDSVASRYNLRYSEQKWIQATADLVTSDPEARRSFLAGDMSIFASTRFNQLGGLKALQQFDRREEAFEALRQSPIFRQSQLAESY